MRRFYVAAAAFFAFSAAALAQFEGVAEFKGAVHTERNVTIPSQGKVYLSKNACRVEWQTDLRQLAEGRKEQKAATPDHFRMVMIQKLSEPERIYNLNDERKTYSVTSISKEKPDAKVPARTWKVQKLGRDAVAGLACEKALLASENGDQTEVCVSRELIPSNAWLAAMNQREEQRGPLKALKDAGLGGFPIRWVFHSKRNGEISSTIELVHFDKRSVAASLFEIPAGYRRTDASSVMMTPEQEKAAGDARQKALQGMTPEERKQYEEYLKQHPAEPQR